MKKDFTRTIAHRLDVPDETLSSIPLGIFRGKGELSIENHKGIIAYSSETIRVAVHRGAVVVQGRDLTIASIGKEVLTLRGIIRMIELE